MRRLLCWALIAYGAMPGDIAFAQVDAICMRDAIDWSKPAQYDSVPRAYVVSTPPILRGGAYSDLVVKFTQSSDTAPFPQRLRAFMGENEAKLPWIDAVSRKIDREDRVVKDNLVTDPDSAARISVKVPNTDGLWPEHRLVLVACDTSSKPMFLVTTSAPVSNPRWSTAIVISTVVLAYVLVALGGFLSWSKLKLPSYRHSFWRHLDPVVLSAGSDGKGSISKLQALYFSLIVVGVVFYVLLRDGYLANLSTTVLALLGISGVGAAVAKAADTSKSRIDFDNWAWLIEKKWLQPGGLAAVSTAQWRDIVTTEGEFDVYRFQMVAFSIVVGFALLIVGANDLGSFTVPQTLLGVMGLSQVVYLGGKLATPPSYADLNNKIGDLRKAETAFVESAIKNADPMSPLGTDPTAPPTTLQAAKRRANPVLYAAYMDLARKVMIMFQSVTGRTVALVDLEPAFE